MATILIFIISLSAIPWSVFVSEHSHLSYYHSMWIWACSSFGMLDLYLFRELKECFMFCLVFQSVTEGKMKLNLSITAGLLLLVQTFHMASLQNSTDSPGRTIMKEWLRNLAKNKPGSQNKAIPRYEIGYDQGADATAEESSNDYSSGISSGSMADFKEEDGQDDNANDGSADLTAVTTNVPPMNPNVTTKDPEFKNTTVSPSNATTDLTNSSSINATEAEEEFNTTTTTLRNSTGSPDHSNHTDLRTTTSAPEGNATQESTTRDKVTWSTNATGSTNTTNVTTTAVPGMNGTSTSSSPTTVFSSSTLAMPEMNATSTASSPTTVFSSESTETSSTTQTVAERANRTDEGSASGENPERGTAAVSSVPVAGAHFSLCPEKVLCVVVLAAWHHFKNRC